MECGVPAEVVGASRVYSSTTEGSRATYTCWDTFKEFLYTGTRYCTLEEGGWAISPLVCVCKSHLFYAILSYWICVYVQGRSMKRKIGVGGGGGGGGALK